MKYMQYEHAALGSKKNLQSCPR